MTQQNVYWILIGLAYTPGPLVALALFRKDNGRHKEGLLFRSVLMVLMEAAILCAYGYIAYRLQPQGPSMGVVGWPALMALISVMSNAVGLLIVETILLTKEERQERHP